MNHGDLEAFDADVLIYAAIAGHPLGDLITERLESVRPCGSVLLYPELLPKPTRAGHKRELTILRGILASMELRACTEQVAVLAMGMGARYGLRAPDAIHLATAVAAGATAFHTNNTKDFDADAITEIQVIYPDRLAG